MSPPVRAYIEERRQFRAARKRRVVVGIATGMAIALSMITFIWALLQIFL